MQPSSAEDGYTMYPLTYCDVSAGAESMTKGWVVEGVVDVEKIREAFDRVVAKWRMLAGRVVFKGKKPYIRIPLGPLPANYASYTLTTADSSVPLSTYNIPLPIPAFSTVLPHNLFLPPAAPLKTLESLSDRPFIHWHVTRFPHAGEEYSCIGMQYPHGVFDGLGSSFAVHALAAELAGKPWDVPLLGNPTAPGTLKNPFHTLMESEVAGRPEETLESAQKNVLAISVVWIWQIFGYVWEMVWNGVWGKVGHNSVIIPHHVHTKYIEEVRGEAARDGLGEGVRLGVGDIFFAWLLKALYSSPHQNPQEKFTLWNQTTLRTEWPNTPLALYSHNRNVGQHILPLSASQIITTSTSTLAYQLAKYRNDTPRLLNATRYWHLWASAQQWAPWRLTLPIGPETGLETLPLTNVSMARVAEVDWSGAGGGRGLANYVWTDSVVGSPSRMVAINGRLANGDLVMTLYLTRDKGKLVEEEVKRLLRRFD